MSEKEQAPKKSKKESKEGKEGKKETKEGKKEPKEGKKEGKETKPRKEKRKADDDDKEPKKKRAKANDTEKSETKVKPKTGAVLNSVLTKVRQGSSVVFTTESNAPCFLAPTLKVAADLEQWNAAKEKNDTETVMVVDITTLEIAMPLRVMSLQPLKYMTQGLFLDHEKLAFCFSQSDLSGSKNHTLKQNSIPDALKVDPAQTKKPTKKALTKPVVQEWFFQVQDAKGHNYGMTMATFSELMQLKKIAPIEITEKSKFTMATDDDRMFLVPEDYVEGLWKTNSKVTENLSDVTPAISEAFMKELEK